VACVVLAAALLVVPAQAAPGDLDPSFGVGGKVTTDYASRIDFALGVVLQADGKIVAAGNTCACVGGFNVDFALARYNTDGSLDGTFGGGGQVTTDWGTPLDAISAIALQADGKIVAVGLTAPSGLGTSDFGVARYNTDGSLDATFGAGGKVATDFGGGEQGNAVVIQTDGKIVAAGASDGNFALARYNANGTLDTAFGSGGMVITDFGAGEFAFELALQADGKIIAAGMSGSDFALARYNPNGSLDATFGTGGEVTTDCGSSSDSAFGVVVQADGKIIAGGVGSGDVALARYNANGSLDPTFGSGGRVTTDLGSSFDVANTLALQGDGKIVAAGGNSSDFALVRYSPNGSLDTSFGSGGVTTTDFGSSDSAFDVAVQTDGKIVAVGGNNADFTLARYQGTGLLAVSIDIKPGSATNPINLTGVGVVPVAILSSAGFAATSVDPATVCFGDDGSTSQRDCTEAHGVGHREDVNGDGLTDLLLHYEVSETGIDPGDTRACLTGTTFGGVGIQGCDSIRTG
jgi:uncharacterized delta-60 repeat protein